MFVRYCSTEEFTNVDCGQVAEDIFEDEVNLDEYLCDKMMDMQQTLRASRDEEALLDFHGADVPGYRRRWVGGPRRRRTLGVGSWRRCRAGGLLVKGCGENMHSPRFVSTRFSRVVAVEFQTGNWPYTDQCAELGSDGSRLSEAREDLERFIIHVKQPRYREVSWRGRGDMDACGPKYNGFEESYRWNNYTINVYLNHARYTLDRHRWNPSQPDYNNAPTTRIVSAAYTYDGTERCLQVGSVPTDAINPFLEYEYWLKQYIRDRTYRWLSIDTRWTRVGTAPTWTLVNGYACGPYYNTYIGSAERRYDLGSNNDPIQVEIWEHQDRDYMHEVNDP